MRWAAHTHRFMLRSAPAHIRGCFVDGLAGPHDCSCPLSLLLFPSCMCTCIHSSTLLAIVSLSICPAVPNLICSAAIYRRQHYCIRTHPDYPAQRTYRILHISSILLSLKLLCQTHRGYTLNIPNASCDPPARTVFLKTQVNTLSISHSPQLLTSDHLFIYASHLCNSSRPTSSIFRVPNIHPSVISHLLLVGHVPTPVPQAETSYRSGTTCAPL